MTDKTQLLNFQHGNAKLGRNIAILSLPAGHTCPFAKDCRSSVGKLDGKVKDGPHTQFRCYATTAEAMFPNIRKSRWNNLELIKQAGTVIGMASLIERSLAGKKKIKLVRFHQSGDFFSQVYFDAWLTVAKWHPEFTFYGYTKALPYLVARLNDIPTNFKIVASRGGSHDHLIEKHGLRSVRVVYSQQAAAARGLKIDHDDSLVYNYDKDFAIVIHGTQMANSEASRAWTKIYKRGKGGYKSDYFGHTKKKGGTITINAVTVTPTAKAPLKLSGNFKVITYA